MNRIYRCNERLGGLGNTTGGSTCLTYTGLCGGLEHLKMETRLISIRYPSREEVLNWDLHTSHTLGCVLCLLFIIK
jgi:hypothetical protein